MQRRPRTALAALATTGALVAALALSSPASASSPNDPNTPTPVSTGITAKDLKGASAFEDTPGSTPEAVSFILKARNKTSLTKSVTAGTGKQLSVKQFAKRYGQTPAVVNAIRHYLAHYGIKTTAYANRLDITARGTAAQFNAALAIGQQQYYIPGVKAKGGKRAIPAQTVHGNTSAPKMPHRIADRILAVLGLTNYSSNVTHLTKRPSKLKVTAAHPSSTVPDVACEALTGIDGDCNTPQDFASRYNLANLYGKGAKGKGRTVGIVTLAGYDRGSAEYFWNSVINLKSGHRKVTVVNVDGGPGAPSDASGTGETDLDVQQAGGVAPDANVRVYQAPNTDAGFADAFFLAASQNVADSVSTSWGEAETVIAAGVANGLETSAYEAVFDEAFLEFGAQKQASFAAAGDAGAYDDSDVLGTTELGVANPASSPYITAAGGTTLPTSFLVSNADGSVTAPATVRAERAWGWDYLWQPVATVTETPVDTVAESLVVGTGGGFSAYEAKPSYQRGVSGTSAYSAVEYLTPTDPTDALGITEPSTWSFNPTPPVTTGVGSGRALPDLSTNADPNTGYLLYEPSAVAAGFPALSGGYGGTSFVAPQLNGAAAVLSSALGHRIGFVNPALYKQATAKKGAFTPLQTAGTTNDNLYYTGNPGAVFNESTGLGLPNFAAIAKGLAHKK